MRGRSIACAAILAAITIGGAQSATPPTSLIQDTLYRADGSRFDGIVQISWETFQAVNGSEVPKNTVSVRVVNGYLRVVLVPTTNALQPAYYTAAFNSAGRTQFVETWAVPPSTVPLRM